MCSDVGRQVVRAGEVSHADPALEGLLSGVGPHVSGQLVASTEPSERRIVLVILLIT